MATYIVRRLLLMIPTLVGVTAVVFFVMALAPGGFGGTALGEGGAQTEGEDARRVREYFNKRYGLDQPPIVQYGRWLNQVSPVGFAVNTDDGSLMLLSPQLKWPNLGESLRGRPVVDLLIERLPITLLLNLISVPIIYIVAISTGVIAAKKQGGFFDVTSGVTFLALWSVPVMWVGVMMIGFLANTQYLQWFPTGGMNNLEADAMRFLPAVTEAGFERGYLLDALWHLVLPVICLTYGGFAVLAKLTRASVLENASADYARTARAKGVAEREVLWQHVFRNSLLPLITVFAAILPSLFVGAVVVETIFSIPGLGKLGVEAAFMKDRELVMGTTLIGAMIGLSCEIGRDICYAIADPRVSYE